MAWLNRIQLIMGHTVYSLTTTIAAYMIGLALGAIWAPKILRSKIHPLSLYLIAELAVGIYGLLFYPLLSWIQIPYDFLVTRWYFSLPVINVIQFLFCGSLVLIPTFLMGTTLPLLSDFLSRENRGLVYHLPRLYGINTFGAVVGALLGGFFILPSFGYLGTIQLTASINFFLFIVASLGSSDWQMPTWLEVKQLARCICSSPFSTSRKNTGSDRRSFFAFYILFISGFICTSLQIIWNRLAALSFGPSVYVFPLVTAVVLIGIVLGSLLAQRMARLPSGLYEILFSFIPALSGLALLLGHSFFTETPWFVLSLHQKLSPDFFTLNLAEFLYMSLCLLPAASLLGSLFPTAVLILTKDKDQESSIQELSFGYAVNILGLITGAVLGAFVILPLLGLEDMSLALFSLLVVSSLLLASFFCRKKVSTIFAIATISVTLFGLTPPWDWNILTSGYFYNRTGELKDEDYSKMGWENAHSFVKHNPMFRMLDRQDDPHATVSIHQNLGLANHLSFKINGKADGSNSEADLRTTRLMALLPALVNPHAESALIVGLGIGSTAAMTLRMPDMKSVKVIELSPAMIEFSKKHFNGTDGYIWEDPKFSLVNRDGRDYLSHSNETYDWILSEPSNPWVDGVASLFTSEYLELAFKRLNPGGTLLFWFHTYGLDCLAVNSVLQAAKESLPEFIIFSVKGDLFIVASQSKESLQIKPYPDQMIPLEELLFTITRVKESPNIRDRYEELIINSVLYDKNSLETFYEKNTDDNQFLQFQSGRTFFKKNSCQSFPNAFQKPVALSYFKK